MKTVTLSPNVYCPFCGILLEYQWVDPSSALEAPVSRKSWLQEVRANLLEQITLFQKRGMLWGYGFHDACWKLVVLRLPDVTRNCSEILRFIFQLLYTTQCPEFSSFCFGHDYSGAANTHKPFGLPKTIDQSSSLYANPHEIPTLAELECIAPEILYLSSASTTVPSGSGYTNLRGVQGLVGLPLEVIELIISYLPLTEAVDIRLVCRRFAVAFKRDNLPQSFWNSRFMIGSDMDYLFPDFRSKQDWMRLYLGTRASIKNGNHALANRKRIVALIEPIACLLELCSIGSRELCGLRPPLRNPHRPDGHQSNILDDCKAMQSFSGQLAPENYDNQLEEGCRAQQFRMCQFPFHVAFGTAKPQKQRFGASAVTIGAQSYVCGISSFDSQCSTDQPCRAGYCVRSTEKTFDVPCHGQIGAIEVAFCASGLVGIRFICVQGDTSMWIGECEGPGIGRGLLRPMPGDNKYCFVVGLDAYKIVSFGLIQDKMATKMTDMRSYEDGSNTIESYLWIPQSPAYSTLAISPLEPLKETRRFNPILNIDFGGPCGSLLPSLTRVVVHMVSEVSPVVGFEFFYLDRTLKFGAGGDTEISALIDGPGGERIINVQVIVQDLRIGMGGLQIETSWGYTYIFSPMPRREAISKKVGIEVGKGRIITGFLVTEARHGDHWERLGLQTQPLRQQLATSRPVIQDPIHHLLESRLGYDKECSVCIRTKYSGEFRTYASLNNVRRIQVSSGLPHRSRSSSHVSGLRFDYYNQCRPAIVGQWMKAHEDLDSFEIDEGEKIEGLSFWLSKEGESSEIMGLGEGKVVAVRVDTSLHRSKLFESRERQLPLIDCMLHQYQSDVYDEITAISWILNSSYDRVQAVTTSNVPQASLVLVAEQPPPFDQVQKLFFENVRYDVSKDILTSIVGHIHQRGITGISFLYQSGTIRSVGFTATDVHQTVSIMDGEHIVRFTAGTGESKIRLLEFQIDFSETTPPKSRTEIIRTMPNNEDHAWRGFYHQDTWYATNAVDLRVIPQISNRDRQYSSPPGAKFVGIFVGCQDFIQMGAIFDTTA